MLTEAAPLKEVWISKVGIRLKAIFASLEHFFFFSFQRTQVCDNNYNIGIIKELMHQDQLQIDFRICLSINTNRCKTLEKLYLRSTEFITLY